MIFIGPASAGTLLSYLNHFDLYVLAELVFFIQLDLTDIGQRESSHHFTQPELQSPVTALHLAPSCDLLAAMGGTAAGVSRNGGCRRNFSLHRRLPGAVS